MADVADVADAGSLGRRLRLVQYLWLREAGVLSEGQIARLLGTHRVEARAWLEAEAIATGDEVAALWVEYRRRYPHDAAEATREPLQDA
jgi:hypothetical protein